MARAKREVLSKREIIVAALAALLVLGLAAVRIASAMWGAPSESLQQEDDVQPEPSAVYYSNTPFDLTGSDGDMYRESLDWVGTMRITISDPVVYADAKAAGFEPDEDLGYSDFKVVVVEVTIENIDATCREEEIEYVGSSALNAWMFNLECDGGFADALYYSAPKIEGNKLEESKADSYVWAEPGSSVIVRIGFVVVKQAKVGTTVQGDVYDEIDAASTDLDYRVVLNSGWSYGAPVVELGPATLAEEGDAQ